MKGFSVSAVRWKSVFFVILTLVGFLTGTSSRAGASYITIPDGQTANGSPVLINTLHSSDLATRQYRLLGKQSDGFNGTSLNAKWTKTDIGNDPTPAPTVGAGDLTLVGGGNNITGTSDKFTYLYQNNISGDFTIDVYLKTLQNTNAWAKAGIMVRQSLSANSRHAFAFVTPGNGAGFYRRTTDGGNTTSSTVAGITAPRWLRLIRSGNIFSAWYSTDGRAWSQIGANQTLTMTNPVTVGLAVTSRVTGTDCTTTFDNFLFMPSGPSGMNTTWTNTSSGSPASIVISNWSDGLYALSLRDTGTTVGPETNTFNWSSCVDGTPSTITIPGSQTVKGSAVSLGGLFTTTGNPGSFTYKINGSTVGNPWNSLAFGTVTPEAVTLEVTGVDPDCGTTTVIASNTITVDNTCTDGTPSTITVRTGQTVGGPNVDLTTLYTKTGNVAGFTYKVNGNTVTSPWNSTSYGTSNPESVTLEVRGTDPDCGGSVKVGSNLIDVDNTCVRAAPTISLDADVKYVGEGRALQFTATVHNHDSPNCSPATFNMTVAGETNAADFNASTLTGGSNMVIAGAGSTGVPLTVSAKAGATEWNENITTLQVTSSEGAHGTVQKTAKTIVFLVSPITHNSITTNSTKWSGNWGTSKAGAKYGNFTCLTCHEKDSGNVKWMRTSIPSPDGTNWGISGVSTLPITFQDARNHSADWGNDDPNNDNSGRATSNKTCEVCHSATFYHRYDTNTDPDGAGSLTPQSMKSHFNTRLCVDCHRHSNGFTAGCDFCHGNPPTDPNPGGPNGLANIPHTTGSTTMGTHFKHVSVLGYPCTYCHSTYRNTDIMPNEGPNGKGNIDLSFKVFGLSDPAATAGSYSGQDGVSYNGVVVPPGSGTLTCTSVYCHGATIGGNDPEWSSNVTCNACHGTSAMAPPPGKSHETHVGKLGRACSECHGGTPTPGSLGHVNGTVKWDVSGIARHKNTGPAVTYRSAATGDTTTLAPSPTYGTCTNVACHYGRTTPPWNNNGNPATCTTCHNDGADTGVLTDAAPNTGAHPRHMNASSLMASTFVNKCESCHGAGGNSAIHVGHIDFTLDFAEGFTWTSPNCTNYCHGPSTLNDWNSAADLKCQACHQAPFLGPTVVFPTGDAIAGMGSVYGSHLKVTKAEALSGGTDWEAQCKKCHPYHSAGAGVVTIALPPTSWDNPGTVAVETDNMAARLGLEYVVTGGVHLGGASTSGTTEADMCWNCHGTDDTVNEWGYNADSNSASFPTTIIADINSQSQGTYNHGWIYSDAAWTTATSAWVDASGKGMYFKFAYQHDASNNQALSGRIASVHSADFDPAGQSSSVGANVDVSGMVKRDATQTLETRDKLRCTYCHDVHDLNRALADPVNAVAETATGRPYLRGSWMGNPYPPDMPPLDTYQYPTTGGPQGYGNRYYTSKGNYPMPTAYAPPRLFPSSSKVKGGYFIDQNSDWPTKDASYDTLEKTGGVCTLCHGTDVDNMDFYRSNKLWRPSQANGHANSTTGGSGAGHANAKNIFDARRGATAGIFMGVQDGAPGINQFGKFSYDGLSGQGSGPHSTFNGQPADGCATCTPPVNGGWYGGTEGSRTRGGQYATWFSATGIGTDGSAGATRAHSFTCSKCHNPHAARLPALLITNCLDVKDGNWNGTGAASKTIGPQATSTWGRRVANNCHRKESWGTAAANRDTGWNYLAPAQ